MLLHEAVRKARKDLGLSQKKLSELAGIQRRQLATLESGGNITLSTLRKVLVHLPNLETFSLDAVTATVLRQVDPAERRKAIESAISLLANALRGLADKASEGQLPDETDLNALREVNEVWDTALGYDESDLERKRARDKEALEKQLAAYRGGADAAFASIMELAQRKASRRRQRAAKDDDAQR